MPDLHLADDDASDILYQLYKAFVNSPIPPVTLPDVPREAITGALFRGAQLTHENMWGPGTALKRLESQFHMVDCTCQDCLMP